MIQPFNYQDILSLTSKEGLDNKVIIALPDSGARMSLEGFLTSEISLPISANFDQASMGSNLAWINSKINSTMELLNRTGITGEAQTRVMNVSSSMVSWTESSRLAIDLGLLFVRTSESDRIIDRVKAAYDAVAPDFETPKETSDNFIPSFVRAPGGYAIGNASKPTGVISIKIGRWLKIMNMMVMNRFQPTFSRETTPSGSPLYATVSISMTSYRMVSVKELQSFFTLP